MIRLLVLFAASAYVAGNPVEIATLAQFFRGDYNYSGDMNAMYKAHYSARSWEQARFYCEAEGAELAAPEDIGEANYLLYLLTRMPNPVSGMYLGMHSKFAKGYFVNLRGIPIEKLYNEWENGEPNDVDETEDCLVMVRTGKLNDVDCGKKFPFVCKKSAASLRANPPCQTYDSEYEYEESLERCYKINTEAKTWKEAYQICAAEGSYLAVINSEKEMKYLTRKFSDVYNDKIYGNFATKIVLIGFHDLLHEGEYRTIFGQKLEEAGFENWCHGQPDDEKNNQNCGGMLRDGTLDDVSCHKPYMFACEKEIEPQQKSIKNTTV